MMNEQDWERLTRQLVDGHCTPFLGAGACVDTLPSSVQLAESWADRHHYPFQDHEDLARVMQYASITVGDAISVKEELCKELADKGYPDFTEAAEPHALLATFPITVFVTTNYDDFLFKALKAAGKEPDFAISPWMSQAGNRTDFKPVPEHPPEETRPLVFHLHGRRTSPSSLVLTEDDYLEFLANIASTDDNGEFGLVPSVVNLAMTDKPLLFIGYSLRDWTFRVLFHGLLRTRPQLMHRRSVSVQLLPPVKGSIADAEQKARQYMDHYLDQAKISIYWGTAQDFCTELRGRLAAA
jgi:hypothetical protein